MTLKSQTHEMCELGCRDHNRSRHAKPFKLTSEELGESPLCTLSAGVDVIIPHDIILTKVTARLHLN